MHLNSMLKCYNPKHINVVCKKRIQAKKIKPVSSAYSTNDLIFLPQLVFAYIYNCSKRDF